jgi:hypothetical protein
MIPWGFSKAKNGQVQPACYKTDATAFIFSFSHQTIHRIIKGKE